jgi:hypothetical protein
MTTASTRSAWQNMSRILTWMGGIAIGSLLLGFAFFLIIESAAMILLYSAEYWQTPRRIVARVTGVDVQRDRTGRRDSRRVGTRVRIILNIAVRAGFMIAGVAMLVRLGFLRQNLLWLLFYG